MIHNKKVNKSDLFCEIKSILCAFLVARLFLKTEKGRTDLLHEIVHKIENLLNTTNKIDEGKLEKVIDDFLIASPDRTAIYFDEVKDLAHTISQKAEEWME